VRTKLTVLVIALVALVAGGISIVRMQPISATESLPPPMIACSECHSMETEVQGWQQSAHANIACLQCHTEGDVGWVRHNFTEQGSDMAAHDLAATHVGIKLKAPNDRCTGCHDPQMDYLLKDQTPPPLESAPTAGTGQPMEVKAFHDKHISGDAKLLCTDCHTDSAHGPAAGTLARRDDAHALCLDCHEQEQVKLTATGSVTCTACHIDAAAVAPPSHQDAAAWQQQHGPASVAMADCGQCHLANSAGPHGNLTNPAAFAGTAQDACLTCHAGTQMPHEQGFLTVHGDRALAAAPGACETCHSPSSLVKPTPEHAASGYCTDCHAGVIMPHPAGFLAQHGQAAANAPATCEVCHSSKNPARPDAPHAAATFCNSCHDAYQHPTGWVGQHGTKADASCAVCHDGTEPGQPGEHNSCAACHQASGQWHPAMWFVSHARAVEQQGEESCMQCHATVEPSCTQCHRNR
jgi:hypothetical protein